MADATTPTDAGKPRVTLGIATYNRETYLAEAIRSGLQQDFVDLEVLVVVDGSTNPAIDLVLGEFADDPRVRVFRHERNLGIAAAYNSFVSQGRGELIAMIGDDDACLPGRIRRQVEIFERFPDTGIVHGDAIVIDSSGQQTGIWNSAEFAPAELVRSFFRIHNHLVDPSRMVHRRVYDTVGGYDERFPIANDFDFWLRAARSFRFRHCPGGPIVAVRRHGENASDESAYARQLADVEGALTEALDRYSLRELVPELDWSVLELADAERQALLRLAALLDARRQPMPGLATRLRRRAERIPATPAAKPRGGHGSKGQLLMTSFGWNDAGGGTTVPRLAAKELARRGWEVTVFHAAVGDWPPGSPYNVREWEEDGVRLIGVYNRPHGLWDLGNPWRELDDPPISAAWEATLDRVRPDVVHYFNLNNLGASLINRTAARGIPAYFSPNNYWLVCPRGYLIRANLEMCAGPRDGGDCAACVGSADVDGHRRRLGEIRSRAEAGLNAILSVSHSVRRTLLASGYPADLVDVVRQTMPHESEIWEQVGRDRAVGRIGERLTVAFLGSAYPHKGPQLLIEAAQRCSAQLSVQIYGEVSGRFAEELRALDVRGVAEFHGKFEPSEIPVLLASIDAVALPSMWWDCAPLAAFECHAARVPLLVPRLGGLPESIRDGVDGLSFAPNDAADLAVQLDRLALEPGLLERLQVAIEPTRRFSDYIDELEAYYSGQRPGRVSGPPPPESIAVRWQGDHGQNTSLAIVNDRVTELLPGHVQRVTCDARPLDGPAAHAADIEVRHQWPPDLRPPSSGRLAVIQPWEFGAVPRDWLAPIRAHVDELWVPSEWVRQMYVDSGVDPDRVVTIPNGVDLELFHPEGDVLPLLDATAGTRFLFVGGLIWRKGPDVLLSAWREAFAGRTDVTLVIKDFGADSVYRGADRGPIREYAESGEAPRVLLIDDELSASELAALYRASDVLVHPYRGEGFAMPVLEAMASGLPVITTGGGPTDEFCPETAGWRIRSRRVQFPSNRVDSLDTAGRPWVLEADAAHLVELLTLAASDPQECARRGRVGALAAMRFSWQEVARRYAERLTTLAARTPRLARPSKPERFPLTEDVKLRVLATPAWRTDDRLGELLAEWTTVTTRKSSACLYLLADPAVDGTPAELETRVLAAAAATGAPIDAGADINVLMEPVRADRDIRLHSAVDAYVPLHPACSGHQRLARSTDGVVIELGDGGLARLVAARLDAGGDTTGSHGLSDPAIQDNLTGADDSVVIPTFSD